MPGRGGQMPGVCLSVHDLCCGSSGSLITATIKEELFVTGFESLTLSPPEAEPSLSF